jgi:hypothetical protein
VFSCRLFFCRPNAQKKMESCGQFGQFVDFADFAGIRAKVYEPEDVVRALRPLRVNIGVVARAVEKGPYVGTGSAHVCVAHAGLAFRVCRSEGHQGHKNKVAFDEMICELRYAQIAHALGVGLPSPFFGVVRLDGTRNESENECRKEKNEKNEGCNERMISCWPLGARVVVPREGVDEAACTKFISKLRARLERLATRLVALDACKPANWVVVDGELFAIDFETHMCFEVKTEAQRDAAVGFVPVMLALFEMNTGLRFDTGIAQGARLAQTLHCAARALIESFAGEYESFEGVRYGRDDVAYALVRIFVAYTAAMLRGVEGARATVALLARVRASLEDEEHEHHAHAKKLYATPCVYDVLEPFTTLAASLVGRGAVSDADKTENADGAEGSLGGRLEAIRRFHDALAVWMPAKKEACAGI